MIAPPEWTTESITVDVMDVVRIVSAVPGVTRLWFFGSAAAKRSLDSASDLDFAVEGLSAERYFAVLGDLVMALRYPLDLVRWEEASDSMRAEIMSNATLLYAA